MTCSLTGRHLLLAFLTIGLLAGCTAPPEERAARYLERAESFRERGDLERARLEARNAVQIEPRNVEARWFLAGLEEAEGRIRPWVQNLFLVIDLDAGHMEARLKLANLMFFGGAPEQSLEQLEALQALAPDHPDVMVLAGRHAARQGDRPAALAAFEQALKLDPQHVEAVLLHAAFFAEDDLELALQMLDDGLGRLPAAEVKPLREVRVLILSELARENDVEAELRALARDYPDDERFQQQLVQLLTGQGRVDDADAVLRARVDQDAADLAARINYAGFLFAQRDPGQAEATLLAFSEENPERGEFQLALAQLYEAEGRIDDARQVYERLADAGSRTEDGSTARNRLAAMDLQAGDIEAARRRLDRILVDEPDNLLGLRLRAGLFFAEGRYAEAIADLRVSLRRDEASQPAQLLLARAYEASGSRVLAKEAYRQLLDMNFRHRDGLMELAMLLVGEGDLAAARPLLERLTEAAPGDLVAAGRYLELLLLQGALDEAEVEARRAMALPGQQGLGEFQLARVHLARGETETALRLYRASLEQRPGDPRALEALVDAQLAAGRGGESLALLRDHASRYPELPHVRFLLARVLAGEGGDAEARALLEGIIGEQPDAVPAWLALAGLYPGDRDHRIATLRQGLAAVPGNTAISSALGAELYQAGRYEEVVALYEQLVLANPGNDALASNLAALLVDHRGDAESLERAYALVRHFASSDNPALLDTLGWTQYRRGEYTEAVGLLERAVASRGDVAVLRYRLGMAYLALGNEVGARQQLREALADGSMDFAGIDEARATLRRLEAG